MKYLIETINILLPVTEFDYCGDYPHKFQDEAYDLLSQVCDLPELEMDQWCDIMFDKYGNVYAMWWESENIDDNTKVKYIELHRQDCERAFEEMEAKMGWGIRN
jgi:hypothetical protein